MFDVMVSTDGAETGRRIAEALQTARMRVIKIAPPDEFAAAYAFHIDVGVACSAAREAAVSSVASMRAALRGPPPVIAVVPRIAGPDVRAAGAVDVLPENTSDDVIVLRVHRAAVSAERNAARVVLRGRMRDVSLVAIVESMARKWEVFHVKVTSPSRRGEASYRRGVQIHVRVDGATRETAAAAFSVMTEGDFEVLAEGNPIAIPASTVQEAERSRAAAPASDWSSSMSHVARAAALVNALSAYAQVWLPPRVVASVLRAAYAASVRNLSDVPRADVSDDAIVTLDATADGVIVAALVTQWVPDFLSRAESLAPGRFSRDRLPDVLGGLREMAERAGWRIDFGSAQVNQ